MSKVLPAHSLIQRDSHGWTESFWSLAMRRFMRHRLAVAGMIVFAAIAAMAVFAGVIAR